MKNKIIITMVLGAIFSTNLCAVELHRLGLNWKDPRTAAPEHEIKIIPNKGSLPSFVDHSANMPSVGNQGSQGSCTAWATAYYHKSYQEWSEHNWVMTDSNHLFSPSFVYNQINGGADNGSWFGDAFQMQCDMGSSSILLTPYNDGDCVSWPSEVAYDSAISYRCDEWFWFNLSDSLGIEGVKQCLNDGNNVVIGLLVYSNYDNISAFSNIFCVADLSGDIRGGHANCIVGYNDSLLTHDGYGAFKVVNSWGASWGDDGYYWMSYKAATNYLTSYQAAFYSSDKIDYQPKLKMRTRINHNNRGSVKLQMGIGPSSSPYWSRQFFLNSSDGSYFGGGNNPFPATNIVFDLTEGASYLDSTTGNNIFLRCRDELIDGVPGAVEFLSAESADWGVGNSSLETPKTITDDFQYRYTNLSLYYKDYTIGIFPSEAVMNQGDSSYFKMTLNSWNGYSRQVSVVSQISPAPSVGSIDVIFDRTSLYPTDSCNMDLMISPDASPGKYLINITGIDSIDTLIHSANITLWVLGSGEALCVGSSSVMLNLVRSRWSKVDSLSIMPPVVGSNYKAIILGSGLTLSDTTKISGFIGTGGLVLSIGYSIYTLSGGSNLLPISQWLGATGYSFYTGSGIKVISDYQNPFGVASIDYKDTLGTLTANNGILSNLLPSAVSLAHLGTVTIAIAALYNEYGPGQSLWVTADAGFSQQVDSLITGFFRNPLLGVTNEKDDRDFIYDGLKPALTVFPAPFTKRTTISINIPGKSLIKLRIYDICGRRVKTLFDGEKTAGKHVFTWDGKDERDRRIAAGIYFIKVETVYGEMLKKIVSVR